MIQELRLRGWGARNMNAPEIKKVAAGKTLSDLADGNLQEGVALPDSRRVTGMQTPGQLVHSPTWRAPGSTGIH